MAAAFAPTSYAPEAAESRSKDDKRLAELPTKDSEAKPTPIRTAETTRRGRLPARSANRPARTITGKEATIPPASASPKGPGERLRARLRSAKRIANEAHAKPSEPKATHARARRPRYAAPPSAVSQIAVPLILPSSVGGAVPVPRHGPYGVA